jgi:hypothetical protein
MSPKYHRRHSEAAQPNPESSNGRKAVLKTRTALPSGFKASLREK